METGKEDWRMKTEPLIVAKDMTVNFLAIKTPAAPSWPDGKPVWSGASGSGDQASNTFSAAGTNYVYAECGNTVTGVIFVITNYTIIPSCRYLALSNTVTATAWTVDAGGAAVKTNSDWTIAEGTNRAEFAGSTAGVDTVTIMGIAASSVTNDVRVHAYASGNTNLCDDEWFTVVKVDITGHRPGKISSPGSVVSEAEEDSPDTLFIAVNDDNDDNGPPFQKDNRNDVVGTNDDDVVRLTLKIQPAISNGVVELSITPSDSLRLFKADGQSLLTNTTVDLSSPSGDLIGLATGSVDIVVEGKDVAAGDPATNVSVKMAYKVNGQELCADEIHMHMTWIILPTATIWNPFRFYFGNCGEDELRAACTNRGFTVTDRLATVDPGDGPNLHTVRDFFNDISTGTVGILWMDGHGNAESNVVAESPIETYTNYATALASFNNYTNQGFLSDELVIRAGYTPKPWAICVTTRFIEHYCTMRDHSAVFLALCYSAVSGGGAPSLADAFAGTNRADNSFGYDDVSYTDELISDTKAIFETVGGLKPISGTAKNYTIREAYDGGGIDANQANWPAHLLRGSNKVDSVRMYVPH